MAPNNGAADNKVKVSIRVRPLIQREKDDEEPISWMCYGNVIQQLQPGTSNVNSASLPYSFDHIFNQESDTKEVYEKVVQPIVQNSFQGFNGAVLCYGQTSSGKTYTLYGSEDEPGIIYLVAEDLFKRITEDSSRQYYIRVSLLEVYNEKVWDLLGPSDKKPIDIVTSKDQQTVMPKDVTELEVFTAEDMLNAAKHVQKARRIGETKMNKDSSRSHTIVRIIVESVEKNEEIDPKDREVVSACLNLADLAGSEKASQTGAVGDRLKEATYINKSLSTLAQVVLQLSQASGATMNHNTSAGSQSSVKQSSKYVSFRDSKLTRLLQSSLEGNAFISLICNVTPASVEETHSTLRFARTAKLIKVDPTKNLRSVSDCKQYKTKISELENLLNDKASEVDKLKQQLTKLQKFHPFSNVLLQKNLETTDRRKTMCPSMLQWERNAAHRFGSTVQSEFKHPSMILSLNRSALTLTNSTDSEVFNDAVQIFDQQLESSKKRRAEDRNAVIKVDAQTETDGLDEQPHKRLRQNDMSALLEVLNQRKLENTETINELCTEKSFLQHEYELVKEDLQVEIESLQKTNAALIAANEGMKMQILDAPSKDEMNRLRESYQEQQNTLVSIQKELNEWKETAEDCKQRLEVTEVDLEEVKKENLRLQAQQGSAEQGMQQALLELEGYRNDLNKKNIELTKFEAQIHEFKLLEKTLDEKRNAHSELVEDHYRIASEKASLELQIQDLKKHIETAENTKQQDSLLAIELRKEISSLEQLLEQSASAHAAILLEKSEALTELVTARSLLESHEAALKTLEINLVEARNEAVELKDALTDSRERFETAQKNNENALEEKQDLLNEKLAAMLELKQGKDELEVKVNELCEQISSLQREYESVKENLQASMAANERIEKEMNEWKATAETLEERLKVTQSDIDLFKKENKNLDTQKVSAEQELQQALRELQECKDDLNSKNIQLNTSQKECSELMESISAYKGELEKVISQLDEITDLKKKNEEYASNILLAKEQVEAQTQELQLLEKAYDAKNIVHSELAKDYDRIAAENSSFELQIQNLRKRIQAAENAEQQDTEDVMEMKNEIRSLKQALEESTSAHAAILLEKSEESKELSAARTLLENHEALLKTLESNLIEFRNEAVELKDALTDSRKRFKTAEMNYEKVLEEKQDLLNEKLAALLELQEAKEQLEAKISEINAQNSSTHHQYELTKENLEVEIKSLQNTNASLLEAKEHIEEEANEWKSTAKDLEERLKVTQSDIDLFKKENKILDTQKVSAEQELQQALRELQECRDDLNSKNIQLTTSQKECSELMECISALKSGELEKVKSQLNEISDLRKKNEEYANNILLAKEQVEAQTEQLKLIEKAYAEEKTAHSELIENYDRIAAEKASLELQIQDLKKQIQKVENTEQLDKEDAVEYRHEINSLEERLEQSASAHAAILLEKSEALKELVTARSLLESREAVLKALETNLVEARSEAVELRDALTNSRERFETAQKNYENALEEKQDLLNEKLAAMLELKQGKEELEVKMKELFQQISSLQHEYESVKGNLQVEMESLQKTNAALIAANNGIEKELTESKVTVEDLEQKLVLTQIDLEGLKKEYQSLDTQKDSAEQGLQQTLNELEECRNEINNMKIQLSTSQKECSELKDSISAVKGELENVTSELAEMHGLKKKNEEYENYFLLAAEKFEAQTQELKLLEKAFDEKRTVHSELVEDYDRIASEKASLEIQIQNLKKQIEATENTEQRDNEAVIELKNEISSLKQRLEESASAQATILSEKSEALKELVAAQGLLESHEAALKMLEINLVESRNEAVEFKDALTDSRKRFETVQKNYENALEEKRDLLNEKLAVMLELKLAKEQLESEVKVHQNCASIIKDLQTKIAELDEEKENNVNVKVKKRSIGIQIDPSVDVQEKLRSLQVETYKLNRKYSELSQTSQRKISAQNEEIKDLTKKLNEYEPEVVKLQDALGKCLLELDGFKSIVPVQKVSAEVQCDTMKDSLHRLLRGQRATLPKGYPDVYTMAKDYEKVRGELAILESWKRRCECNKKRGQLGLVPRIGALAKPLSTNQRSDQSASESAAQMPPSGKPEATFPAHLRSHPNVVDARSAAITTDPCASPAAKFGVNLRPTGTTPASDRITRQTAAAIGRDLFNPPTVTSRPTAFPPESNSNTEEDDGMTEIERLTLAYIGS